MTLTGAINIHTIDERIRMDEWELVDQIVKRGNKRGSACKAAQNNSCQRHCEL